MNTTKIADNHSKNLFIQKRIRLIFIPKKYSLFWKMPYRPPLGSGGHWYSGTTTEFCIPDHCVQAAVMVKIRTFKLNPDLFRTTFWTFPDLKSFYLFKLLKSGKKVSKMVERINFSWYQSSQLPHTYQAKWHT